MRKGITPLLWVLFSAGGTVGTPFYPGHLFLSGFAVRRRPSGSSGWEGWAGISYKRGTTCRRLVLNSGARREARGREHSDGFNEETFPEANHSRTGGDRGLRHFRRREAARRDAVGRTARGEQRRTAARPRFNRRPLP